MKYTPDWGSLNARPVPAWFADAKFGIFIHWGLYSVPAYTAKGQYAEWYQMQLREPDHPARRFHDRVYGPGVAYKSFVNGLTAELFDAKAWMRLFERAGARYMNVVSKHHDGFAMYETKYAPEWNSMEVGPKRDFLKELRDAAQGSQVRFGAYHSVYEWFHPLYRQDPERYATEHLLPMLKELVEKYEPATLFTDGEWEHPSATWHSTEFLAWLYNDSPVRDFVVPNDRWGSETRGRLGGNFTTEYGEITPGVRIEEVELDRPYEECRGIGRSFGYNRCEGAEDYQTAAQLIDTLCELVSRGGNLLLNVGPAADGMIPPIMEERLLEMGDWLRVNGEAIYGTRPYVKKPSGGIYYTRTAQAIFAMSPRFPFNGVTLGEIPYDPRRCASILGCDAQVMTENDDGKLRLIFPPINPERMASKHMYAYKITRE